jgi:hypothetical protein
MMNSIWILAFLLAAADSPQPVPGEIRLTIARDPYTSSDQVTLCRVRAINDGSRTWPGNRLRFEARAVGTVPAVRERGRFGMELRPFGSLETLIALPGRHDRLEVVLLPAGPGRDAESRPRKRSPRRKKSATPR